MGFVLEKRKKNKTTQITATYVESKLHPKIMRKKSSFIILVALSILTASCVGSRKEAARWVKYENNPVLGGGDLGTILIYKERMYTFAFVIMK
jgi:hypothetical protein